MAKELTGAKPRTDRLGSGGSGGSDEELLERFLDRDGEDAEFAFATLVERHGPMVWRVCRAELSNAHDALDAFQATFLVLVEHAGSIRRRDSVASWLHGVARRTAATLRAANSRRRTHERLAAEQAPRSTSPPNGDDLGAVLHAELIRLPRHAREILILCDLEGLTEGQAAARLNLPIGTVRSRLARGRIRLRRRLIRRGIVPAVVLAWLARDRAEGGEIRVAQIEAVTRAALHHAGRSFAGAASEAVLDLTRKTVRGMLMIKLTFTITAAIGIGLTALAVGAFANSFDEPADLKAIQGTWAVSSVKFKGGDPPDAEQVKQTRWVINAEEISVELGGEARKSSFTLDPDADPKAIDIVPLGGPENEKGQTFRGIYKIEENTLTICFAPVVFDLDRPERFETGPESLNFLYEFRRVQP